MNAAVLVRIVGAPIACKQGVKDSWREVSTWAAGQLRTHFGDAVQVKYYDLFDVDCPSVPTGSQLPLVFIDDEIAISGGKISIPILRNKISTILEKQQA